ncbi:calcium-binding protein [Rhodobacter sp. CZR27]|uniref:calcium-binding protein n=1 Tax=Rhodobacter sp. CZR27 TaxID=2033869 RepID=UPI000BBE88B7|nr:calcium-binding protein [Rhodobacter sp. CZR27]
MAVITDHSRTLLCNSSGEIHQYDISSGATRLVADTGLALTDMAMSPDGTLYAITAHDLFRIDLISGQAHRIASLDAVLYAGDDGISSASGFDISPDGVARISFSDSAVIVDVNLGTGDMTRVNNPSHLYNGSPGDIFFDYTRDMPVYYVSTESYTLVEYRRVLANGVPNGHEMAYTSTFVSSQIDALIGKISGVDSAGLLGVVGSQIIDFGVPGAPYSLNSVVATLNGLGQITGATLASSSLDLYHFGNDFSNLLAGGATSEILLGRGGNDSIHGGAGQDDLYGGTGHDLLNGGAGNDRIDGGTGNDRIDGGDGIDQIVFSGAVSVTVNLGRTTAQGTGQGIDAIANVERVTSASGADRLIGSAGDNVLRSGSGNDTLNGGAGNDALFGGTGNDILAGSAGADAITGNAGRDVMTGGAEADRFIFVARLDTGSTAATADRITDFVRGSDRIDLSAIDAAIGLAGNNAFVFRGTGSSGTASSGAITYELYDNPGTGNDHTLIFLDVDVDVAADAIIRLDGIHKILASDFLL